MLKSFENRHFYDNSNAVFVFREETQHALSIAPDHFGFKFNYFLQKAKCLLCEELRIQHGWCFNRSCLFKPQPVTQPIREEMLWTSLQTTLMKREQDDWKQGFMKGSDKWLSAERKRKRWRARERLMVACWSGNTPILQRTVTVLGIPHPPLHIPPLHLLPLALTTCV